MSKVESASSDKPQERVTFHYIKSDAFRVIHVDGAIGSVTPKGNLHVSVYSERLPIPKEMTFNLKDDGTLGELVEVDGRRGVVREVEAGLIIDRETAVQIRDWLSARINDMRPGDQQGEQ